MTFGYLVLTAMGLIEWRLRAPVTCRPSASSRSVALFLGGLVISLALLAGAEQAGGGIYLLTQLIAVVAVRRAHLAARAPRRWLAAEPIRHSRRHRSGSSSR